MRSKIIYLFLFLIVFSMVNSCRKEEEAIVNCLGESILTSLKHQTSTSNVKQIDLEIGYSGDKAVTSINWDFGDGNKTTTTVRTTSHTYATAGTYEVKADVNLDNGKCTVSPKRSVTVE